MRNISYSSRNLFAPLISVVALQQDGETKGHESQQTAGQTSRVHGSGTVDLDIVGRALRCGGGRAGLGDGSSADLGNGGHQLASHDRSGDASRAGLGIAVSVLGELFQEEKKETYGGNSARAVGNRNGLVRAGSGVAHGTNVEGRRLGADADEDADDSSGERRDGRADDRRQGRGGGTRRGGHARGGRPGAGGGHCRRTRGGNRGGNRGGARRRGGLRGGEANNAQGGGEGGEELHFCGWWVV